MSLFKICLPQYNMYVLYVYPIYYFYCVNCWWNSNALYWCTNNLFTVMLIQANNLWIIHGRTRKKEFGTVDKQISYRTFLCNTEQFFHLFLRTSKNPSVKITISYKLYWSTPQLQIKGRWESNINVLCGISFTLQPNMKLTTRINCFHLWCIIFQIVNCMFVI